jgi:hypothetical protein
LLSALLTAQSKQGTERGGYSLRGPFPGGDPWPETLTARDTVSRLLTDWSDDVAGQIFAPNVDLDRPLAQRRAEVEKLRERIGPFAADPNRPAEFDSPAHCRWWLTGEAGTVAVQIKLAPLRKPVVQQLDIAVPPAPGSPLAGALDLLKGALNAAEPHWPASLPAADGLGTDQAARQLRVASVWTGPCALDCYLAGNGETSATVLLGGPDGKVTLAVSINESGQVAQSEITLLS